eukprot:TRINITY_DN8754_c0_g1_i3.p1 TRINITY_DN8754_c0_g1~~TRINITY_DN8754_c0_g1_i3.p1  ORF type:complete len:202 (+),score=35.94 TRINITY_DN8754_c0_g1_i3:96-701(+)
MCLNFETVQPPTEESKVLVQKLRIIFFIHLAVAVIKTIFLVTSGLIEFLNCFILYLAYSTLNYCNCVMYIIFNIMSSVAIITIVGQQIQSGSFLSSRNSGISNAFTVFNILTFIFYIVAIRYAFLAYREFKAITNALYSGGMNFAASAVGRNNTAYQRGMSNDRADPESRPPRGIPVGSGQQQPAGGFRAFGGAGVSIGGN